jgi:hypothetical protein
MAHLCARIVIQKLVVLYVTAVPSLILCMRFEVVVPVKDYGGMAFDTVVQICHRKLPPLFLW